MKIIILILFTSLQCFGLECPDGAYEVEVDLLFSQKKVKFCQRSFKGRLVKHGPEKTFDMNGKTISEKYFINNVESAPPKMIENVSTDICNGEQDYIRKVVKSLFVNDMNIFYKENELVVGKCTDCCRGYPQKRLNFFLKNKPFTNSLVFKKQCYFQGDLIFNYDRRVDTKFRLKGQLNYDHLKISYIITKLKKGKRIVLKVNILNGEFSKSDNKNFLKFSALQDFEIDTELLLISRGAKGLYSNPPTIKIIQLNDKTCT